jgi:sirohydrochlorin ferrochelatase
VSTGLVIFAHGSSVASANAAVESIAAETAKAGGFLVQAGFLEPVHPSLDEAVETLVKSGVCRVLVVPYFLTLGLHLQRDLPVIVERLKSRYPAVEIRVTPPLDGHAALTHIVLDRAAEALQHWGGFPPAPDKT